MRTTFAERREQAYELADEIDYRLDALEPALEDAVTAQRDLVEQADRIAARLLAVGLEVDGLNAEVTALRTAGSLLASGMSPARVRAELARMQQHRPREA